MLGPRSTWARLVAIAIASALGARIIAYIALADVPHVMDEIAYLFEAKLIASGHLTAPVALPRAAFNMWFVDDRVARFGVLPPGWPVVLAIGVRLGLGLTHWINPLLHLATVIVVGRAGARLGGPRLEVSAALLYGASPQTVLLAASLMSHSLVALAASVVTYVIVRLLESPATAKPQPSTLLLGLGGAAVGIAIATRPLCGVVVVALPLVAIVLLRTRRHHSGIEIAVVLAAMAPFVIGLGAFNQELTGSALRFPQNAYFEEHIAPVNVPFFTYGKGCNALGFGAACDHAAHTVWSALSGAGDNLRSWLVLVGPIVFVGATLAVVEKSTRAKAGWAIAPVALAIILYGLSWQAGVCYGARFYHAALPSFIVGAVLGLGSTAMRMQTRAEVLAKEKAARERADADASSDERPASETPNTYARDIFAGVIVFALFFNVLGFAVALREIRSWSWWGTDDRFAKLAAGWTAQEQPPQPAVVMVAFGRDDVKNPPLYATAAMSSEGTWLLGIRALAALGQNEPIIDQTTRSEIVFAKFHPALVSELAMRFPNRKLWLYTASANRREDVLEPWSPSMFGSLSLDGTPRVYRAPADNFDGFRVGAPLAVPDPLLREPTDEGWPR